MVADDDVISEVDHAAHVPGTYIAHMHYNILLAHIVAK